MPRLPYAAETFVMHAGVLRDFEKCLALMKQSGFRICLYTAGSGWGKTHFSLKLADEVSKLGLEPDIISGTETALIYSRAEGARSGTTLIVDDAHAYFESLGREGAGGFVAFIEHLRQKRAAVIFLSGQELEHFSLDQHVTSRLAPGLGFRIEPPLENDMQELVTTMLSQRGLIVPPRKLDFVLRRIPRDLPAISQYLSRVQHLALSCGGTLDYSILEACLGLGEAA